MTSRVLLFALLMPIPATAQTGPPVVRAGSRVVTVVDGQHVRQNYWYVMPERSPDVYYVEIPRRPHTVTFTTDRESIAFDVSFGSIHRFVIRLEDGKDALTEVRAVHRAIPPMTRTAGPPSIPFTLGDNDKIYVDGRLNGGSPLRLQVDLGSGGTILKKGSVSKANITFDRTTTLRNSDGVNIVPESSSNLLALDGVSWQHVVVTQADNMTWREDGLIGNLLWREQIVEIDHDRQRLTIHDTLPDVSGWTREDMVLDGGTVPFVRGRFTVGDSVRDGWFLLDTGAYTSILNSDRLSATTKFGGELRRMLGPLGGTPAAPVIEVAGRTFAATNYSRQTFDGDATALGVLGNDLLKRFNLVLDNQQGAAYFRPSRRMSDGWRNPERKLAGIVIVGALAAGAVVAWRVTRGAGRGSRAAGNRYGARDRRD